MGAPPTQSFAELVSEGTKPTADTAALRSARMAHGTDEAGEGTREPANSARGQAPARNLQEGKAAIPAAEIGNVFMTASSTTHPQAPQAMIHNPGSDEHPSGSSKRTASPLTTSAAKRPALAQVAAKRAPSTAKSADVTLPAHTSAPVLTGAAIAAANPVMSSPAAPGVLSGESGLTSRNENPDTDQIEATQAAAITSLNLTITED